MTNVMTTTDLPRAEASLRDAVASGSAKRIDAAGARLMKARDAEARRAQRDRDREAARLAVEQERRDADHAARQAASDAAVAELRESTPTVVFEACGRRVTVLMSAEGLEAGWSAEACRRLAWGVAGNFAQRVQSTRSLGRVAPEKDWLTPFLTNEGGGLHGHLKRGIVTVERITKK